MSDHQMLILLLVAQAVAGGSLFFSSACRLRRTNGETLLDIRMVIWLQSVAAVAVVVAPYCPILSPVDFKWTPLTTPWAVWLFVAFTAAAMQIVTSRHWKDGVPRSYIKPKHRPLRRSGDDFRETRPC